MSVKSIKPARRLRGEITIPGDKSISHRAVMFGFFGSRYDRNYTFFKWRRLSGND